MRNKKLIPLWKQSGITFKNRLIYAWCGFNQNAGGIAAIVAIVAMIIALFK